MRRPDRVLDLEPVAGRCAAVVLQLLHVALRLGIHTGLLSDSWAVPGSRLLGVVLGVGMILFGNALPTVRSPWPHEHQPFSWQQVHRFVGWMFVLGGTGVVGSWLLSPAHSAARTATAVLSVTLMLSLGRKAISLLSGRHRHLAR